MKKNIFLITLSVIFFFTPTSTTYAQQNLFKLPPWFIEAIQPIQDSIKTLVLKINNLQNEINELQEKVENIDKKKVVDFDIPENWIIQFYQISPSEQGFTIGTCSSCFSIPPAVNKCQWKGAVIDSYVSARAVAHLPTGDIYGAGSCKKIEFRSIDNFPESGSSFEAEVYLWWQGTEKYTKQTITVPDRPFPAWGLLNFSNPNSSEITISPSGTIGIGATTPTEQLKLKLNCGSQNCEEDLKLQTNN